MQTTPRWWPALGAWLFATACGGPRPIDRILAELNAANGAERARLAAELNDHGAAAVPAWISLLQRRDYGLYVIAAAELAALDAAAEPAIPALVPYLRDGFPGMQQGEMTVFQRFEHPDIGRTPASSALSRIGAPAVAAVRGLLDHEVAQTRQEAARTLGSIGAAAAAAVPDLLRRLSDADKAVAVISVWALGEIGHFDAAVSKGLRLALIDEHQLLRFESLRAVGKLGAAAVDCRDLVKKLLEDRDEGVRRMAADTLQQLPAEETGKPGTKIR